MYRDAVENLLSSRSGTMTHEMMRSPPMPTIAARPRRFRNWLGLISTQIGSTNSAIYPVMKWHANVSPTRSAATPYDLERPLTARQLNPHERGRSHIPQSWDQTPSPR